VRQITQRRSERGIAGAFVTQRGQSCSGKRVIDDTHIHGHKL
jgi:hypothetical protein